MPQHPLIIGHRGASAVAPENTMAAFRRAIEAGADGIEFDVRLSADGVPFVIHDETLHRTGLRSDYVARLTAEELQHVNVGRWFHASGTSTDDYANETLPSLQRLLGQFSSNNALLYLEIKCRPDEQSLIVSTVCEMLRSCSIQERVIVECFDLEVISKVKQAAPDLKTAALFQPRFSRPQFLSSSRRLVDEARKADAVEIALHHKLADDRTIEIARRAGLKVVVWTVDDPGWIERARNSDVHALITNDPATMIRQRDTR